MIAVNGRFLTQELTGVQRYAFELTSELVRISPELVVLAPSTVSAKEANFSDRIVASGPRRLSGHRWEQFVLPGLFARSGAKVLLNFCNTAPLLVNRNWTIIHDVGFLRVADSYDLKFRLAYRLLIPLVIQRSRHVGTVSDFSRRELASTYRGGSISDGVGVYPCGVSRQFVPSFSTRESFALMVGSASRFKRTDFVVEAWRDVADRTGLSLKVVGGQLSVGAAMPAVGTGGGVEFLGRVSDEALIDLYQRARCLIAPSDYEGFGLPALEAQACGATVLTSGAGAQAEVLGNSAIRISTDTREQFVQDVAAAVEGLPVADNAASIANASNFSWSRSAAALAEALRGDGLL